MESGLRFDVFGRFQVAVRREGGAWVAYRGADGLRVPLPELVLPADLAAAEIVTYLDDAFHELAAPGQQVVALPG